LLREKIRINISKFLFAEGIFVLIISSEE